MAEKAAAQHQTERLAEVLQFIPWWDGDPGPPWILQQLDKATLVELAKTNIELRKEILGAHMKAADRALAILSKVR